MLSLERPIEVRGIPLFRDHADKALFYYAAPNPKISKSGGRLLFDLLTYAVDLEHSPLSGTKIPEELGAGFLTMTVDCEMSEADLSAIRYELSLQVEVAAEDIALFPIPYTKGTVRVLALDKYSEPSEPADKPNSAAPLDNRPTFVEQILGSSTPSLLGGLRAIFSLSLSQEGAVFLEKLYEDGAAPVGVTYELTFLGLRPAVDIEITADLSRIYTHFGGGLEAQYKWLKADIDAALDYLEETGAVRVKLLSQAVGAEAQASKELGMSLFKDRIVSDLFRPTAQSSVQMPDVGKVGKEMMKDPDKEEEAKDRVVFKLEYKKREELKTVSYNFSEVSPEERSHAPQGFLAAMITAEELDKRTHEVELASDFFELLEVLVTGPTEDEMVALGIRQVEATLSYGADEGEPDVETLLFRPGNSGDKTFAVRRDRRTSLSYECALTYEFARSRSVDSDSTRYELPATSHTGRSLRINPFADFGVLDVEIETGRVHEDVQTVDVDLRYESPDGCFVATETVRLTPHESPAQTHHWQVRTAGIELASYQAQCTFYFSDGSKYEGAAKTFDEPLLRVDSPFQGERTLLIFSNILSKSVRKITVEIEYADETNQYERSFLAEIDPPFESTQVSWPILDLNARRIRYRTTVHEPGYVDASGWNETDEASVIVGALGSRVETIEIRLIGDDLPDVGVDAVLVKVKLVDPGVPTAEQSLLLESKNDAAVLTVTLSPDAQLAYSYQTTAFLSDGSMIESEWKEGTGKYIPLPTKRLAIG